MTTNLTHYLSSIYFVNQPQYGPIKDTMTLLKHIEHPSLIVQYEQFYIHPFHHNI